MKYGAFIDLIFTDYLTDITGTFLQFYSLGNLDYSLI